MTSCAPTQDPAATSPRVRRRRHRTREALLRAACEQFCRRGVEGVSVEDLIVAADVSRATFYSLFSNKYQLLEDIINPVCEDLERALVALAGLPAADALEQLFESYARLWQRYPAGMRLLERLASREPYADRCAAVERQVLEVLDLAERSDLLRNGSARLSARILRGAAVPLLEAYDGHPLADALFVDAMRGLLLRAH